MTRQDQAVARRGRGGLEVTLAASGVSMLGSAASYVAVPWLVYLETGSAALTGMISAAASLGAVGSGVVLGSLLDRSGFRRMSVVFDLIAAIAIGVIPLAASTIGLPLVLLAVLACVSSAGGMASATARQSMLPELCDRAGLPLARAIAFYWTMQRTALALAALPVGFLIAFTGPLVVLWVDAGTFAGAAVLILFVRSSRSSAGSAEEGYLASLRSGFRLMRSDALIGLVLGASVVLAAFDAPLTTVVLPVVASDWGADYLGVVLFGYAVGTAVGTVAFGVWGVRVPQRPLVLGCLVAIGAGYVLLPLAADLYSTTAILALMGLAAGPLTPMIIASVQQKVPAEFLGRVTGTLIALVTATTPAGRALGGHAIEWLGMTAFLLVVAFGYFATAGWLLASRTFRSLMQQEPGTEGGASGRP